MRHVYPNRMVAHLWANQSQDEARSGNGNLYFRDRTIFSYGSHFAIARHVEDASGQHVILYNRRSYSPSTSQHQSAVRRAIPDGVPVFEVGFVANPYRELADIHTANLRDYRDRIDETLGLAKRARKYKAYHLEQARSLTAEANSYSCQFEQAVEFAWNDDLDAMLQQAHERAAALVEAERQRHEREQARLRERAQVEAVEFLAGRSFNVSTLYHHPVMLRVEGERVITSRGAEFPVGDALRVWPRLREAYEGQQWVELWECPVRPSFGQFRLDQIAQDGIKAGCHHVLWTEVFRFAATLGLEVPNG